MAIGANSYGSVAEVAAVAVRFTSNGSFDATTNPTLAQVETMVDRISGLVNVSLARVGFAVPVSQADAKAALDDLVVDAVARLVCAVNGTAMYYQGNAGGRVSARSEMARIRQEIREYVTEEASGLAALGATRSRGLAHGLNATLTDTEGEDLDPMFDEEEWQA